MNSSGASKGVVFKNRNLGEIVLEPLMDHYQKYRCGKNCSGALKRPLSRIWMREK
jgi:hypothetical protein